MISRTHPKNGDSIAVIGLTSSGATHLPVVSNDDQGHTVSFNSCTSLLKSTENIKELGTPSKHISCVSFVFIPDDNIEAAKEELKDLIYASFHGNVPPMGMIIGVLNAVWAKSGPRILSIILRKVHSFNELQILELRKGYCLICVAIL